MTATNGMTNAAKDRKAGDAETLRAAKIFGMTLINNDGFPITTFGNDERGDLRE